VTIASFTALTRTGSGSYGSGIHDAIHRISNPSEWLRCNDCVAALSGGNPQPDQPPPRAAPTESRISNSQHQGFLAPGEAGLLIVWSGPSFRDPPLRLCRSSSTWSPIILL